MQIPTPFPCLVREHALAALAQIGEELFGKFSLCLTQTWIATQANRDCQYAPVLERALEPEVRIAQHDLEQLPEI